MKKLYKRFPSGLVLLAIGCLFLVTNQNAHAQNSSAIVGHNVLVGEGSEVSININKHSPNQIVLSANTLYGDGQLSTSSMDEGLRWSGNTNFFNLNTDLGGDPSTAIDANGNMYVSTMYLNPFGHYQYGYYLATSSHHDSTFGVVLANSGTSNFDKEMIVADDEPSSPYANNVYCAYAHLGVSVLFNKDSAGMFSSPITLYSTLANGGDSCFGTGANIQTGPNGEIYVCWANYDTIHHNPMAAYGLGFCKSLDGGNTWSTPNAPSFIVFNYKGYDIDHGTIANSSFGGTRVDCFPSMAVDKSCLHNGRIYVTYGDIVGTKYVVQVRYSDNEGNIWSTPATVSTTSADSNSFFPSITVDDVTGSVYVAYYITNNSTWSTNTYMSYSMNGGATYNSVKVSDTAHILAPIATYTNVSGYAGDYIGIAAHNDTAHPAWMDDRPSTGGTWYVYTARVSVSTLKISSNTTFSSNDSLQTDIEVTPGHTLTIPSGVVVKMAAGHKIIVDTDAELNVSGTITHYAICGNNALWDGIEVQGNANAVQRATDQGTVVLNSGSKIEYAKNGIVTVKSTSAGWDWNYTGGIIKATGATFYNNENDVEFLEYDKPNSSYFRGCTFSVDNTYYSEYGGNLQPMVTMYRVYNVGFEGNTFENDISYTNMPYFYERGTGIYSTDASYSVNNCSCLTAYPPGGCCGASNTFTSFEYGIQAINIDPSYNAEINGNSFTNNYYDIDIQNINSMVITNNSFSKTRSEGIDGGSTYNIYLDQCTGYNVSGNTLSNTHYSNSYGIIVNNSGPTNNLINNNIFDGIYIQTQSQGMNGLQSYNYSGGLQYHCNAFNSSISGGGDISVVNGLIAPDQGSRLTGYTTANNSFNNDCSSRTNILTDAYLPYPYVINYFWAGSSSSDEPNCVSATVIPISCIGLTANCSLPTYTINVQSGNLLNADGINYHIALRSQKQSFQHTEDSLTNVLAKGNTSGLFAIIATGTSPTIIQDSLLAPGPYLSDSVLKAAIMKSSLPHETLANILIPNTPLDSSVVSTLDGMGLPDTLVARLNEYQSSSILSHRSALIAGINYCQSLLDFTDNALITALETDTTIASPFDSAQAVLKSDPVTLPRLAQLASLQWAAGENTTALVTLDTLKKHDVDSTYSNYRKLLPVLITLSNNSNGYLSLKGNSTDSTLIAQIAMDTLTPGYANARAVLRFVYNQSFAEPILPLSSGSSHKPGRHSDLLITTNAQNSQLSNKFNIFPNPANNELNIQYSLDNNAQNSILELFDEVGNKVAIWQLPSSQIKVTKNIAALSSGFYFYTILTNNKVVQRGKLVIAR